MLALEHCAHVPEPQPCAQHNAGLLGAVLPLHPRYGSAEQVRAALPDLKKRVAALRQFANQMSAAACNRPEDEDSVCTELKVEIPLILSSVDALERERDALEIAVAVEARPDKLATEEDARIVRFEALLRRTEARVYVLLDDLLGH